MRQIKEQHSFLVLRIKICTVSVVYTGFRGWGGTFLHWRNKKFSVFSNSKNLKKFKKAMKNL